LESDRVLRCRRAKIYPEKIESPRAVGKNEDEVLHPTLESEIPCNQGRKSEKWESRGKDQKNRGRHNKAGPPTAGVSDENRCEEKETKPDTENEQFGRMKRNVHRVEEGLPGIKGRKVLPAEGSEETTGEEEGKEESHEDEGNEDEGKAEDFKLIEVAGALLADGLVNRTISVETLLAKHGKPLRKEERDKIG